MPDYSLDLIQDLGLKELDKRGLIIWENALNKPIGFYLDNSENTIAELFSKTFGETATKLNDRERLFLIASIASHAYVGDTKILGDDLIKFATILKTRTDFDKETAARMIQFLSTGMYP
jgi:hypothetical protein